MSGSRKFFVIGNWKMNVNKTHIDNIVKFLTAASLNFNTEAVVGCPSCYLSYARHHLPSEIGVAAQNCYKVPSGNFSGEISPAMIQDCGCEWVILGHPERRAIFNEPDELISEKVAHAQQAGMKVVACVCERKEDRDSNRTEEVLFRQMESLAASISDWSRVVVAFEALWASGTGILATPAQVQEVLAKLRYWLRHNVSQEVANSTRIIYAGSVSSATCLELAKLKDLDGFLVSSAALNPDFVDIINSSRMSSSWLWEKHQHLQHTTALISNLRLRHVNKISNLDSYSPSRTI
ncbi:triosephosphate isomerase-like [Homarus americanus]|uniref:triosephosphate isomerase-like n=1 Tax=Homarus americanus TaxID=6706 RepID=UPI001C488D83|nr:triosephosphate isomerase-like [Homarus americanus]